MRVVCSCSFPETLPGLISLTSRTRPYRSLPFSNSVPLVSGPHTLWVCLLAPRPLLCGCLVPSAP